MEAPLAILVVLAVLGLVIFILMSGLYLLLRNGKKKSDGGNLMILVDILMKSNICLNLQPAKLRLGEKLYCSDLFVEIKYYDPQSESLIIRKEVRLPSVFDSRIQYEEAIILEVVKMLRSIDLPINTFSDIVNDSDISKIINKEGVYNMH